jgi:serine/threonine protein kinase
MSPRVHRSKIILTSKQGLKVLYSAGYVHRDISTGNVLLCETGAKISDLEYARPFEILVNGEDAQPQSRLHSPLRKELKTVCPGKLLSVPRTDCPKGTPAFMAVEVQSGDYLYTRDNTDVPDINAFVFESPTHQEISEDNDLIHNYLHDLESVWWIANYMVLSTVPLENWDKAFSVEAQRSELIKRFPHTTGGYKARSILLENAKVFIKCVAWTTDKLFRDEIIQLVAIREELRHSYDNFYADMEKFRRNSGFMKFYESFSEKYRKARDVAPGDVKSIHSIPVPRDKSSPPNTERVVAGSKRPLDGVDEPTASKRPSKRRSPSPDTRKENKENCPVASF